METAAALPATVRFASAHRIPLVWLGGLPIAAIDRIRSAEFMLNVAIARRTAGGAPPLITSANGQVLSMCARDPQVRGLFDAADLIHADGTPLVLASRLRAACRFPSASPPPICSTTSRSAPRRSTRPSTCSAPPRR